MRITLLNQYYAPDEAATAQMLGDLGVGLTVHGHQVSAICCDRSYADPSRRYRSHEVIDGVAVRRAPSTAFGRGRKIGRLFDYVTFLLGAIMRLLFGPRPDVVISLTTPPMVALIGNVCARLRGARSIFWSMDVYPDLAFELGVLQRKSIPGRLLTLLSTLTLRSADVVVALGETMAALLTKAGAARVVTIHNWADEQGITRLGPEARAGNVIRQRFGWDDEFVVMYSGNMGLGHEFETLLSAIQIIEGERHNRPIGFAFIGGGPRYETTRQRAAAMNLRSVDFHHYVAREELEASLGAADLHVVTLRNGMEGLMVPSKIYGILAAGRPTLYVGPEAGEVFAILSEGRCGTTRSIGDASGVARAISSYADDPDRWLTEGLRARALFEERYTRERAIRQFAELVDGLG